MGHEAVPPPDRCGGFHRPTDANLESTNNGRAIMHFSLLSAAFWRDITVQKPHNTHPAGRISGCEGLVEAKVGVRGVSMVRLPMWRKRSIMNAYQRLQGMVGWLISCVHQVKRRRPVTYEYLTKLKFKNLGCAFGDSPKFRKHI